MKIERDDLVSIIVPFYNSEKYLEECLASLVNQSYSNIEILMVDSGSKDASPGIIRQFMKQDDRIRIISSKKKHPAISRNAGLQKARGQYIMFVDSDDYVTKDYVEVLLSALLEYDAEIAQCNFYKVKDGVPYKYLSYEGRNVFTGRELSVYQASFVGLCTPQTAIWNKIYRREIFDNLRFSIVAYEDMEIAHKMLYPRKRVAWVDDHLYYWRIHSDSATSASSYHWVRSDEIRHYIKRTEFFRAQGDEELTYLMMKRSCYVACQHLYSLEQTKKAPKREALMRSTINEYYPQLMKSRRSTLRTKLRLTFIRCFPAAFGGASLRKPLDFRI